MLKLAMDIKLVESNCLQLSGKKETVLINPSNDLLKKTNSRIVVYNKQIEPGLLTANNKVLIVGPGEYEVGGVEIIGLGDGNGGVIYSIIIDGVTLAVLANIKTELTEKKIDKLGSADVLVADVGQNDTAQNKALFKLAKGMGVNYLVPIGAISSEPHLIDFLNVTDNEGLESVASLKIDKDNLPEGLEVVLLHE